MRNFVDKLIHHEYHSPNPVITTLGREDQDLSSQLDEEFVNLLNVFRHQSIRRSIRFTDNRKVTEMVEKSAVAKSPHAFQEADSVARGKRLEGFISFFNKAVNNE